VALPKHFYSLDAIRGLAALSIVFWHWVHFFRHDMSVFQRELQPLYVLFAPLYLEGWRAVDCFFCLSGFIFYWRYSPMVVERGISFRDFFILRFARLYPLHVLTLVVIAVGQSYMIAQTGAYFVYPHNDFYHFVLQAFLAANWGLERGWSFNAPVWSVSYELGLYVVFFIICFCGLRRWWWLLLMTCIGCGLTFSVHPPLHQFGVCVVGFFAGGLGFYFFRFLVSWPGGVVVPTILTGFTATMWIIAPPNPTHALPAVLFSGWLGTIFNQLEALVLDLWYGYSFSLAVFPLTIMSAALWESRWNSVASWAGFLGRISYSSYLLHFPLQLVFAGVAESFGLSYAFFYTPVALGLFFATLIPLSLFSYHFFELPCQTAIRTWLVRRPIYIERLS
jgi:peptidoglycan/LPS O-acetylase OafA/YrhL